MGFFKKIFSREKKEHLDDGVQKTREGLLSKITKAVAGKSTIDDEVLDGIEMALGSADVGTDTIIKIIDLLKARVAKDKYVNMAELNNLLCDEICNLLSTDSPTQKQEGTADFEVPKSGIPYVILVVGVNGVGKTTTIGKLAYHYKKAGNSVILGAGDTYRAAAIPQLTNWAERTGVDIVAQKAGKDPAAVAFDTVSAAKARGIDVAIIDTAGRLHNKKNLMDELAKVRRVIQKVIPEAPQEILLVLDGSLGKNSYYQAEAFMNATEVNTLAVTKLDGTAKGGVVLTIADQMKVPVKYIGIGEKMEDLQMFDAQEFVKSLLTPVTNG